MTSINQSYEHFTLIHVISPQLAAVGTSVLKCTVHGYMVFHSVTNVIISVGVLFCQVSGVSRLSLCVFSGTYLCENRIVGC